MSLHHEREGVEPKKPCFLGIGCIWAWIYCAYGTPALGFSAIGSNLFFTTAAAAVVLALFGSGLWLRGKPLNGSRWMQFAAPALMVVGTLATAIGGDSSAQLLFAFCAAVSIGLGFAWMCILWGEALVCLGEDQVDFAVLGSSAVMMLCAFIVPSLTGVVAGAVVVLLPVASAVMLAATWREGMARSSDDAGKTEGIAGPSMSELRERSKVKAGMVARVLLVLTAAYSVFGFLDATSVFFSMAQEPRMAEFDIATFIGSSAGIVLALCAIRFAVRIDFASLFRWMIPLVMLAVYFQTQWGLVGSQIAVALTAAADTCIQAIAYRYFVDLAKRGELGIAMGVGAGQGSIQLGVLAGNVAANGLLGSLASGLVPSSTVGFLLILLLAFASIALPPTIVRQSASDNANSGTAINEESAVTRTAREYHLSERETEILGYLVRGRSQPFIQETLYLSKSTVSTHVKHIYKKLDVHSKQELIDLVENS